MLKIIMTWQNNLQEDSSQVSDEEKLSKTKRIKEESRLNVEWKNRFECGGKDFKCLFCRSVKQNMTNVVNGELPDILRDVAV